MYLIFLEGDPQRLIVVPGLNKIKHKHENGKGLDLRNTCGINRERLPRIEGLSLVLTVHFQILCNKPVHPHLRVLFINNF